MDPTHPFDFFDGGLPPLDIFTMSCDEVLKVQNHCELFEEDGEKFYDSRPEIALVALMAASEAFFQSTFSAIGNICPVILTQFSSRRPELGIPLHSLILSREKLNFRLGAIIAENLDFGNANKINNVYSDFLSVSPFKKEEASRYDKLKSLRNQIVHHGGFVTPKFFRKRPDLAFKMDDLHQNSVSVIPSDVEEAVEFLKKVSTKLIETLHKRVEDKLGNLEVSDPETGKSYSILDYFRGLDCRFDHED